MFNNVVGRHVTYGFFTKNLFRPIALFDLMKSIPNLFSPNLHFDLKNFHLQKNLQTKIIHTIIYFIKRPPRLHLFFFR
jgi:hypothetical protein